MNVQEALREILANSNSKDGGCVSQDSNWHSHMMMMMELYHNGSHQLPIFTLFKGFKPDFRGL